MTPADLLTTGILIAMLGSPVCSQRCAAEGALAELGDAATPLLLANEKHADPEVRRRVGTLLGRQLPGRIERLLASYDVYGGCPFLDACPKEISSFTWGTYYDLACWEQSLDGETRNSRQFHRVDPWPEYREATKLFIIDNIYSGAMTFAEAGALLQRLQAASLRQCVFVKDHGWQWHRDELP